MEQITLYESITYFLNEILVWGSPESTIQAYKTDLMIFSKFVEGQGNRKFTYIDEFKKMHATAFREYLICEGYKETTINRKINCLKRFTKYLHNNGHIRVNFMSEVRTSRPEEEEITRILSEEEVNTLIASPSRVEDKNWQRDMAILAVLAFTGCRRSELLALNFSDIDFVNKIVLIKRKKTRNASQIPINDRLYRILLEYYKFVSPESPLTPLFSSEKGNRLSVTAFETLFKKYVEKSGIEKEFSVYPHVLRHTYISRLVNQNVAFEQIKMLTGHRDFRSLERYAHLDGENKRKLVEKVTYSYPPNTLKNIIENDIRKNK
jgi:site-specific recombinase XerD